MSAAEPDLVLHHGLFTTLDRSNPAASAVAIKDGVFTAVGDDRDVMKLAGSISSEHGIARLGCQVGEGAQSVLGGGGEHSGHLHVDIFYARPGMSCDVSPAIV